MQVARYGPCRYFYDDHNTGGVTSKYVEDTLKKKKEKSYVEYILMLKIKADGAYLCFQLLLELSSIDMYSLDGIDVRIRLEMANQYWIVKSSNQNPGIGLNITKANLWIDRVTPHHNAMLAFNQAIATKPLKYVFDKTLFKTFTKGTGENNIMMDQPSGNCIPEKLTMVMVDMKSMAGDPTLNPLHFKRCNISNIHLTINDSSIYNITTDFDSGNYSHFFYETQKSIGIETDNMITHESFGEGRCVFCFNVINEVTEDNLPVEKSANLRLSLTPDEDLAEPHVVILLADAKGIISIDNQRTVTCDVRG